MWHDGHERVAQLRLRGGRGAERIAPPPESEDRDEPESPREREPEASDREEPESDERGAARSARELSRAGASERSARGLSLRLSARGAYERERSWPPDSARDSLRSGRER
jgi:hypothetical protein